MGKKSRDSDDDLSDLEDQIRMKKQEMALAEVKFQQEQELKKIQHANQMLLQNKILEEARKARIQAELAKKSAQETADKCSNLKMKVEEIKNEQARQAAAPPRVGLIRTLWEWLW